MLSSLHKLVSNIDVQNAVGNFVADIDGFHTQCAARVLNRDDKGKFVGLENLNRVYFFINRTLHEFCQQTTADSTCAVQTDI